WAFALIRWKARIDVSGAVRNFTAGLALSIGYGVVLHGLRLFVFPALPLSALAMLCLGLSCASLLGVLFLMLGSRLRVFSLHTFSG
ncbi:MAG TPA: polysaccharide biosynthesis protein, partial [Novosphingobium sp.]|nr:polysaccharide biosynthesis protein [Novosphingobium sp.]